MTSSVNSGSNTFMQIANKLQGADQDASVRFDNQRENKGIYSHSNGIFDKIKNWGIVKKLTGKDPMSTERVQTRDQKNSDGAAKIKDALSKSYGTKFAEYAFQKLGLNSKTSITVGDVTHLAQLSQKWETQANKEFNKENLLFLMAGHKADSIDIYERDENNNIKLEMGENGIQNKPVTDPVKEQQLRKELKSIYVNFMKSSSTYEINTSYAISGFIKADHGPNGENFDTMSVAELQRFKDGMGNALKEINSLTGDMVQRFQKEFYGVNTPEQMGAQLDSEQIMRNFNEIGMASDKDLQEAGVSKLQTITKQELTDLGLI